MHHSLCGMSHWKCVSGGVEVGIQPDAPQSPLCSMCVVLVGWLELVAAPSTTPAHFLDKTRRPACRRVGVRDTDCGTQIPGQRASTYIERLHFPSPKEMAIGRKAVKQASMGCTLSPGRWMMRGTRRHTTHPRRRPRHVIPAASCQSEGNSEQSHFHKAP